MYASLALTLAAAITAIAVPAPAARNSPEEFRLGMEVKKTIVSLTAVKNGTDGDVFLRAGRQSVYPGTNGKSIPHSANLRNTDSRVAHVIGEEPNLAILFDINTGDAATQHGAKVVDVGHAYGNVHPITVVSEYDEFDFGFSFNEDGELEHKLTATINTFMACEGLVGDQENYYLAWGNPDQQGKLPKGCSVTTVTKI